MARSPEAYRSIGRAIARTRRGAPIAELALDLIGILRDAPSGGRLLNAVEHMWGHVRNEATAHDLATARISPGALLVDILAISAAFWLVLWGRPLVALSSPIVTPLTLVSAADWARVMLRPLAVWHAVRLTRRSVGDAWTRAKEDLYWGIAGTTLDVLKGLNSRK
jgi:Protein of unknown function (DUF1722)